MAFVLCARRATIRHRTSIASSIPLSPIPDRSLYPLSLWCWAQSGQEKFKDPHIQEMDEKSFCYPVISQGSETFSQGKKRRVTFMECNNDINSIDIAKVADLVLACF
ncbi:hypothetical protein DAPPUDRAFT_322224 [Daphnia pulex]|uniref:Uncharacterized protein n=1 Tax=Daphnia pulex TaxID=6669 RepID=E9GVA2_DAPPU|nr:hypothetical protein DAPPUDRAFT_322224 [Daphnia pulex]|eukprot:EFX76644.1 hypothetical protein DAPPUDRAFT_322224 [Daphnia pulex]